MLIKKLSILYCSPLCSEKTIEYLFNTSSKKPLLSIQKFHRLIAEGLVANGCNVTTLSAIPTSREMHKMIWWNRPGENSNGVKFCYIPFINFPYIRQTFIGLFAFAKALSWGIISNKDKIIVCDILNSAVALAGLLAAKISGTKSCAVVTDLPQMLDLTGKGKKQRLIRRWAMNLSERYISSYDSYIFLTEQMNNMINMRSKPYMVMEGLVDINMESIPNDIRNKATERILMYAGGIYEIYGLKKLIEAFMLLEGDDLRMHIYGAGDMEKDMSYYMKQDNRIVYQGVVPNQIVVQKQMEAVLLINPRPSEHEYTKYSFPSKNLEYMVSGTPLVTTPLPGMPKEYHDFVYIINDESMIGIFKVLKSLLSRSNEELHRFGDAAKQFVLMNKSNLKQAERINNFLSTS